MIDILLAAYNGEKYIEEQIASIEAQTCADWNLWICDDCSTDETAALAAAAASRFNKSHPDSDRRKITVSVNKKACGGAAQNFMHMLSLASSDYAMFCDQDDYWKPDKVEKTLKRMKTMEKKYGAHTPLLVYTDLTVADEILNTIAPSFIQYMNVPPKVTLPRLLLQNSVTGCTVMMNRALYTLVRQVKMAKGIAMHDHFAALTASVFGKIGFLPEATILYRQHGDNTVGAADARSLSYLWKRYRQGKKQFRKEMQGYMAQADCFYQLFHSRIKDPKIQKLIFDYGHLYEKNKFYRINFYIKNHVIKYGWLRAVMQMIWG